jgi:hypothetical protein
VARRIDAPTVDPHMTGGGEFRCRRSRAHHPRVPKPLIDALAVQAACASARLFGVRLELLLERREFGER